MKTSSLLKTQQYLNNIGFLVIFISSAFCISFSCGDSFFPSKIPNLPLSESNVLINQEDKKYRQVIKMDYYPFRDSVCLQINDYCLSLEEKNLGLFLNIDNRRKRDVIDFRVHKDTPFKYVEQLFNKLRLFDIRLLLFRTNTRDEVGGTTGVKILLPPDDLLYFAPIENREEEIGLLPPVVNSGRDYYSLLFDKTKVSTLRIVVDEVGALFYNKERYLRQGDLFRRLKKGLLKFKSEEIEVTVFLDIDSNVSIQHFLKTYVTIKNVYKNIWDESSLRNYGKKLEDLETDKQRLIRRSFPFDLLWISKNEHQFLKHLKEKGKLDAFLLEYNRE